MQRTPGGHEIPVPSRDEVFRDLAKVAKGKRPNKPGEREDDKSR